MADRAGTDELWALLSPGRPRAREHPHRPHAAVGTSVVAETADERRVPVARQRHADALLGLDKGLTNGAGADELWTLLGPGRPRAREHPHRPLEAVVEGAADERGVPVARQRHAEPWLAWPTARVPTSLGPCWVQVLPERVNTHTAPLEPLSPRPPTRAVFPSDDSATLWP